MAHTMDGQPRDLQEIKRQASGLAELLKILRYSDDPIDPRALAPLVESARIIDEGLNSSD